MRGEKDVDIIGTDRNSSGSGYTFTFHWHNACTGKIGITEEEFNNSNLQPTQTSFICP
jgi:hypothetical protein